MEAIKNRILKNYQKVSAWASKHNIEAYRVYDRDIPEFPFILDHYKNHYVIYDKSNVNIARDQDHLDIFIEQVKQLFNVNTNNTNLKNNFKTILKTNPKARLETNFETHLENSQSLHQRLFVKSRKRQTGLDQYEKINSDKFEITVQEGKAQFIVNLSDYLDTGLFLDHRPLRYQVYKKSKNKSVLNLFCYTGAFSVLSALGGAKTMSLDMSQNYLDWCQRNFILNSIDLKQHEFVRADILEELPRISQKFDIIVLDPPTFSNSKKMKDFFEVERDQNYLITECMKKLNPGGTLYFSNNKRKFKLNQAMSEQFLVRDISKATIPIDFHDQKIHNCFEIKFMNEKNNELSPCTIKEFK